MIQKFRNSLVNFVDKIMYKIHEYLIILDLSAIYSNF